MKRTIRVNKLLAFLSLLSALAFMISAAALFSVSNYIFALFMLCMCLIFLHMAARNAQKIEIGEKGIRRSGMFLKEKAMSWEEIKEIGVIGTKAFRRFNKNSAGALYLYVSDQEMDDAERFRMILDWPPKDKIFFIFSRERADQINLFYPGRIVTYNTGDLIF